MRVPVSTMTRPRAPNDRPQLVHITGPDGRLVRGHARRAAQADAELPRLGVIDEVALHRRGLTTEAAFEALDQASRAAAPTGTRRDSPVDLVITVGLAKA